MKLAELVKELRTQVGDSQQAFAWRLGLSISTVVRAEAGRDPSPSVIYQMAMLARERGLRRVCQGFNALVPRCPVCHKAAHDQNPVEEAKR